METMDFVQENDMIDMIDLYRGKLAENSSAPAVQLTAAAAQYMNMIAAVGTFKHTGD